MNPLGAESTFLVSPGAHACWVLPLEPGQRIFARPVTRCTLQGFIGVTVLNGKPGFLEADHAPSE